MTTLYCSVEFIVLIFRFVERNFLTDGTAKSIDYTVTETGMLIPGYEKISMLDIL
jgi:hypothetical protein